MQAQKLVPAIFLWRNYVGDFRLVEFCSAARAPLEVPKERKKQDTFNPSTKPR